MALCVQAFADTNPILNGFTLVGARPVQPYRVALLDTDDCCATVQERDPGSSRPAELHVSTAATTGTFTGADPGEGLDFTGTFAFAIDIAGAGGQRIGDCAFTDDANTAGVAVTAENISERSNGRLGL